MIEGGSWMRRKGRETDGKNKRQINFSALSKLLKHQPSLFSVKRLHLSQNNVFSHETTGKDDKEYRKLCSSHFHHRPIYVFINSVTAAFFFYLRRGQYLFVKQTAENWFLLK